MGRMIAPRADRARAGSSVLGAPGGAGGTLRGTVAAQERTDLTPFLEELARDRARYPLPPRLRVVAEDIVHLTLELLFPHFAAEVGGCAGDVEREYGELRRLLSGALHLPSASCRHPDEAVDRFMARLPAVREALLLDAQAIYDGDPAADSVDEVILAYPGFRAVAIYRLAHELLGWCDVPLLPRLLTEIAHRDTGIEIHPGAQIGPSLSIDHGTGIVIGQTAVIGARVKLYQGVTLGALSVSKRFARTKRHPTIGDDVVIYANATILGGETVIGSGSRIGGNVWLTSSVPAHSVVTPTARLDRQREEPPDDVLDFTI
jgi:serine O-acetyltransferase